MTSNDSKSYLSYLNKLVNQYNNTYHHSITKKLNNFDYSALTEKMRLILEVLNLKSMIVSDLLCIRTILIKITLKIDKEKYLLLIPS